MFWRWFFYAVWQGTLLVFLSFVALNSATNSMGQLGCLTMEGQFVFASIVIIVNVKVLISSYQYTFWAVFFVAASIVSFFIVFSILTNLKMSPTDLNGEFAHTYGELTTYFVLIFFTFSYILIDNGLQMAGAEIRYYTIKRKQEIEQLKNKAVKYDKTLDRKRYNNV